MSMTLEPAARRDAKRARRADLMSEAKALEKTGRGREAVDLLVAHRADFARVAPDYYASLGGLSARSGDFAAGATHFRKAWDELGDLAPAPLRRDYAMALLLDNQVAAAGRVFNELTQAAEMAGESAPSWSTQPACAVAMIVARNSELGTSSSPQDIEQLLAQAGHEGAAARLSALVRHKFSWLEIPGWSVRRVKAARRPDATTELSPNEDEAGDEDDTPAQRRVKSGTTLFFAGRIEEAGRELSLAAKSGAHVGRLNLQLVVDSYRRANGDPVGFDTSLAPSFTFVNAEKRLVYVAIKKNACTMLKTFFMLNSPQRDALLESGHPIHRFCNSVKPPVPRETFMGPDYFRFVVLRDPFFRLVSVYLNKFVRARWSGKGLRPLRLYFTGRIEYTVRHAQRIAGVEFDPVRSISFAEFVRFLAQSEDYELNEHWLPQHRFVGENLAIYQHVGRFERLKETVGLLTERFGFDFSESAGTKLLLGPRHITRYSDALELERPYDALPAELDAYDEIVPRPERFYNAELRRLVEQRYAADVRLCNAVP